MNATDISGQIDLNKIPQHIAVIMDGNGRWAKQRGHLRIFGHQNAITAVRETTETCARLGVKYLTLYAFSTENWNRPADEVGGLMSLLSHTTRKELTTLTKNDIRLRVIGDISNLPETTRKDLEAVMESTKNNTRMTLILALSYSGRREITSAIRHLAEQVKNGSLNPQDISEETIGSALYTAEIPDPELLIRTSGENRVSNFLLWQIAYTEFYFTPVLWPDFRKEHLYQAIYDFQNRERRFGMTGEQVKNTK